MTEVFRTIHGSHLYGLAHDGSDRDLFIVTFEDRGHARQTVSGEDDVVRVGWRTFLERAAGGSHQSCEALFSPYKRWTPEGLALRPMIEGFRVGGGDVTHKYERTIRKFAYGDFKKRRHAARLWINLTDLRRTGRFWPVLQPHAIRWVNRVADLTGDELLDTLKIPKSQGGLK